MPQDGTIDWPSAVRALRETGYAGVFLYEVGPDADVRPPAGELPHPDGPGMTRPGAVLVNGREYALPARPTAVITVDGCDPRYLDDALARGLMPRLRRDARRRRRPRAGPLPDALVYQHEQPLYRHRRARQRCTAYQATTTCGPCGEEVQLSDPAFLRGALASTRCCMDHGARVLCRHRQGQAAPPARPRRRAAASARRRRTSMPAPGLRHRGRRGPGWPARTPDLRLGHEPLRPGDRAGRLTCCAVALAGRVRSGLLYVSTTDFVQHSRRARRGDGRPVLSSLRRVARGATSTLGYVSAWPPTTA